MTLQQRLDQDIAAIAQRLVPSMRWSAETTARRFLSDATAELAGRRYEEALYYASSALYFSRCDGALHARTKSQVAYLHELMDRAFVLTVLSAFGVKSASGLYLVGDDSRRDGEISIIFPGLPKSPRCRDERDRLERAALLDRWATEDRACLRHALIQISGANYCVGSFCRDAYGVWIYDGEYYCSSYCDDRAYEVLEEAVDAGLLPDIVLDCATRRWPPTDATRPRQVYS